MSNIKELQTKSILDQLFYALAGFDTTNIYIQDDLVHVIEYANHFIDPFSYLILKIREIYLKEEYLFFVDKYLEHLSLLKDRVTTIEDLYVHLQEDISIFKDLDRIGEKDFDINKIAYIQPGRWEMPVHLAGYVTKFVYKHFMQKQIEKLENAIFGWINRSEPGDIVEVGLVDKFNECFWKDMFKLKNGTLPAEIEECGKIVYLLRNVFDVEIVGDIDTSIVDMSVDTSVDLHENSIKKKKINTIIKQVSNTELKPILNTELNQIQNPIQNNIILKPIDNINLIAQRCFELNFTLNNFIFKNMKIEIDLIYNLIFMQDFSIYLEVLHKFYAELLQTNSNCIGKINECIRGNISRNSINNNSSTGNITTHNTNIYVKDSNPCELFECSFSSVSLSEYILKLLNMQQGPPSNLYLINLERFCVNLKPKYLQYFFPQSTFAELEILNRFLFSINAIIYYIENSYKHNFIRIVYLIFMRIKSVEIRNITIGNTRDTGNSQSYPSLGFAMNITDFTKDFQMQINSLLSMLHLTNANVFVFWSELLAICFQYIQLEFKENVDVSEFNLRVKNAVTKLYSEIMKSSGESDFTEFLKRLDFESYY